MMAFIHGHPETRCGEEPPVLHSHPQEREGASYSSAPASICPLPDLSGTLSQSPKSRPHMSGCPSPLHVLCLGSMASRTWSEHLSGSFCSRAAIVRSQPSACLPHIAPSAPPPLTWNTPCSLSSPPLNTLFSLSLEYILPRSYLANLLQQEALFTLFSLWSITPAGLALWLTVLCYFVCLFGFLLHQTVSFSTTASLFSISGSLLPSTGPDVNLIFEGIKRFLSVSRASSSV